jgi:DNA damage-binding protein 1
MIVLELTPSQTEGSIYLLSSIPPTSFNLLSSLQTALSNSLSANARSSNPADPNLTTLGDLEFNTYRAFKNQERETEEPYRFIDGELIERFLDLREQEQVALLQGTGLRAEDVRGWVEELRRGH